MGRTEPSIGRPPAAFRRDARAKKAKATINKLIPSLLSAHPRARRGIEASELIVAPPAGSRPSELNAEKEADDVVAELRPPRLGIRVTDTLTAAHSLLAGPSNTTKKVAILNMASPLSPGGGFLNGATSQEESLCMRTTLLPALRDEFYRLPELGCVYTPDVLVFRSSAEGEDDLLAKGDRWFVDVVSAAMLRLPETEVDEQTGRGGGYVHAKDRELVVEKVRAVMRVVQAKGVAKIVLGAWGCGAYGNPVCEIARAWRRVLLGERSKRGKTKELWHGLDEILFAIKDHSMAEAFQTAFGDGLEWDQEHSDGGGDGDDPADQRGADEEARLDELRGRIDELRIRINRAPNLRVKEGLQAVLAGLETQVPEQAKEFNINNDGDGDGDNDKDDNLIRVLILHANENKAEFAWATTRTRRHLKVAHPALTEFTSAETEACEKNSNVPELLNVHIRGFKLAKFLGRCVLLWPFCDWETLAIEWANQTALALGGLPGHTHPLYGPLIVSVFKQDIADLRKRTMDHVQMRTLRQVADYIQMAADNPCVPNPERFIPVEDSPLIPAIKIKDHLELQLMKSHGMTATSEKVCLTSYCPDDHSQWAAALPFSLDLKWVVRTAALDIHKPVQTKYKHAIDLAWFQWLVESVVDPQAPDEKRLSLRHSHAHCSMAVFHAAGAPLQVEHIHAVQKYLTLKSQRNKHKRLQLRKEDFEAFWKENYAYDGAPPSPYELEASHPHSVVGEYLDELMVLVKREKDQVRYTVSKTRVELWEIMKALTEMYPDEQVERVFSYLEEYSRGVDLDGMEQRARKGNDVGDEAMEKVNLEALQTVREMVGILAAEQLGWMVTYFRGNKLRVGLDQLRRNK